jgi:hypothetical protein
MDYKYSKITVGKLSINTPIDPEIEQFIGAKFAEKISMAFGIPQSEIEQQDIPLTAAMLRQTLPPYKPTMDTFALNIDDALGMFRSLRKLGYKVRRQRDMRGDKSRMFYVYLEEFPYSGVTVIVDTWRHIPRGQVLTFSRSDRVYGLR